MKQTEVRGKAFFVFSPVREKKLGARCSTVTIENRASVVMNDNGHWPQYQGATGRLGCGD